MPNNNPNWRKNLRPPWQKGCAPKNPGGRPRTKLITDAIIQELKKKMPKDQQKRTKLQVLAEALVKEALSGKIIAFNALTDRVEGKATQPIEATGDGSAPVQIIFDVPRPERDDQEIE
jgi:hypothetical protein